MQTVLGIFNDRSEASTALLSLEKMGFRPQDIPLLVSQGKPEQKVGSKGGTSSQPAVSGAIAGIVIGGLGGMLLGLAAFFVPNVRELVNSVPNGTSLNLTNTTGTVFIGAIIGALVGGIIGALTNPRMTPTGYEKVLLAVQAPTENDAQRVRNSLRDYHAEQIRTFVQ